MLSPEQESWWPNIIKDLPNPTNYSGPAKVPVDDVLGSVSDLQDAITTGMFTRSIDEQAYERALAFVGTLLDTGAADEVVAGLTTYEEASGKLYLNLILPTTNKKDA